MGLTLAGGTVYTANGPVTSTNLNAHVSAATVATGADQGDIDTAAASLLQKAATDASISKVDGDAWYDGTQDIAKIHDTDFDAVDDEHPISTGYQIWANRSGASVAAGDVVILDLTGTTMKEFTTTVLPKDENVLGVVVESSIADDATGVIAMLGCSGIVPVLVNGATRTVVKGDFLACSGTAKEAQSSGGRFLAYDSGQDERSRGTPLGAFAIALEGTSSDTTIRAMMLGHVGQGAEMTFANVEVEAAINWGPTVTIDLNSFLKDAKHSPIVRARFFVELQFETSSGSDDVFWHMSFNRSGGTTWAEHKMDYDHIDGGKSFGQSWDTVWVPTSASGAHGAMGDKFTYDANRSETWDVILNDEINLKGYIY